ncbi:hypothetical protein AUEXF2481DRAFT_446790 [Aureobasidium subglaciale EXF-2481]|uniref:Uncharacterized protein n=1 Tax=Aureobasidium subglaciale (strain EXF-2481) TaxID=1043005 RepID=A0A074Y240_AURSE|nr:uncharacterized protein AUEXF2481DRAFT_446790 [Aureobasidium subglaciale EXF-2481]KEQ91873.1 hypothetical protein AUEXF2481DRAFT_446790 [Aureobasidium subglaciale EXF-2481]
MSEDGADCTWCIWASIGSCTLSRTRKLTHGGVKIQRRSQHAKVLFYSRNLPTEFLLWDSNDEFSLGRVQIGFPSADCCVAFLDAVAQIDPDHEVEEMSKEQLRPVLESSERFFSPA